MSFDIFVMRYRDGDSGAPMDVEAFRTVFGPHIRLDDSDGFCRVVAPDGGEADLYARLEPPFTSLMVNHFASGQVLDLVVAFARDADAVLLPPGCPTCITHESQLDHLPEDMRDDVRIVHTGADLEAAIE